MSNEQQTIEWLAGDKQRLLALQTAAELDLNDWCIGAGFVRNLIWDKLHNYTYSTPLNDLDLVYFDTSDTAASVDHALEQQLINRTGMLWSVKNQARMHHRHNDLPYQNCRDAISFWVEIETAVGARITQNNQIELVTPFGLAALFAKTITLNPKRNNGALFDQRILSKNWLSIWPELRVKSS